MTNLQVIQTDELTEIFKLKNKLISLVRHVLGGS
jgi:hypothetical protein